MATSVGSAYVTLMPSMSGFANSITSDFSSAGSSAGSGFTSSFSAKVGAIAGVAASVANKAFSVVANSLDAAISRADTLNNFPTVMQNLGYSADEATSSINKLVAGVDGLPTALDSIVSHTQVMAPLCDSLDEATDLTIAMNNALLASGSSTADCERAFTQYTQMLAKGTVDQASWNSLVEVMPGQLNQLAQALLGAGASQSDLYDAMQDGTITFDDFNNALLQLNEEGLDGFASFSQQAKDATSGIATSMEVARLAVVRNLTEIINKINESGAITAAFESIKSAINNVGSAIQEAIGWVMDNSDKIMPILTNLSEAFKEVFDAVGAVIQEVIGWIVDNSDEIFAVLTSISEAIKSVFGEVGSLIQGTLGWISDNSDAVISALTGIGAAILAWQTAKGVTSLVDQFGTLKEAADLAFEAIGNGKGVFSTLTEVAGTLSSDDGGIVSVFKNLGTSIGDIGTKAKNAGGGITGLSSALGLGPWGLIAAAISAVVAALVWFFTQTETGRAIIEQVWAAIQEAFSVAVEAITNFLSDLKDTWDSMVSFFSNAWDAIKNTVSNAIDAISNVISSVLETIKSVWESVWDGISSFFTSIWDGIKSVVTTVFNTVSSIISNVLNTIKSVWESIWNGIKTFVTTIWNGINSVVQTVINTVSSIISSVLNTIKSVWESIWNGIKTFFSNIWDGIKTAASNAINSVYSIVTTIKEKVTSFFSNAISWLKDAGKNIVEGLWNGITGSASWLWDKISGFFGGIVDNVLSLFGIKSPSKVFAEIGGYTMEGLAVGVSDESDAPTKSVVSVADAMMTAATETLIAAQDGLNSQLITAQSLAIGTGAEDSTDTTLAEILSLIQAIYEKPTDIYMDSNKVSSALASRSRTILAGRGLA